jgi:hypothetical protein
VPIQKHIEVVISDLHSELLAVRHRLTQVDKERRSLAVDAATGNAKAEAAVDKLDVAQAEAQGKAALLVIAIEEAERQKDRQEALAAEADHRRRQDNARSICADILSADQEIDRSIAELYRQLTTRDALIRELTALNVVYPGMISALRRKQNITGAFICAGLDEFTDLARVSAPARKLLCESDKALNNPLMLNDESLARLEKMREHENGDEEKNTSPHQD